MTTPLLPRAAWLGGLAFALAGLVATAQAAPSACVEVAAQARKLPESAWAMPEPLTPWFRRYEPRHPRATLTSVEQDLLDDPRWRQALGATPDWPLSIERLRGTPVYRVDLVAGSENCQAYVLVDARDGPRAARPLATPLPVERPMGLCVTQSAFFAAVLGQPALVVGGRDSMIGLDQHYRVSTWDGKAFGPACTLALKLHGRLRKAEQHCRSDAGWCSDAAALASELAQAYDRDRRGGAKLDPEKFTDGRSPDRILRTTLRQPDVGPGAAGDEGLQLPLLGDEARDRDVFLSSYANVDVRRLAVWLDGRWLQAVVGRAGVGWRESTDTLVTLYEPLGRAIDAQAGLRFTLEASGLASAIASPD